MNEHTKHPPDRRYTDIDRPRVNAMFHEIARNSQMGALYAQSAFRPRFAETDKPQTIGQAIDELLTGGDKRNIKDMVHLDLCPGCFEAARISLQDALSAMNDFKRYLDTVKSTEAPTKKEGE